VSLHDGPRDSGAHNSSVQRPVSGTLKTGTTRTALRSAACTSKLLERTGTVSSTATRRKSMSRRIIVSAGNTEPEIRQRGYVYQKHRKKSDPWDPTKRSYGFYRIDVPGETTQGQIRVPLGFCRDRKSAVLKLHREMEKAGVLDPGKIREPSARR
jgi:hypothetical protein